jgi:hypothetical protein
VLGYDGNGNDMLPPTLGVGLVREREGWLGAKKAEAAALLWNPAEYQHYERDSLSLKDEKLFALCSKANREIATKDKWSAGRSLLTRVAASLRAVDWPPILPVSEDFVVYAVDFELASLRKALRGAARPEDFKRWVREGLVP